MNPFTFTHSSVSLENWVMNVQSQIFSTVIDGWPFQDQLLIGTIVLLWWDLSPRRMASKTIVLTQSSVLQEIWMMNVQRLLQCLQLMAISSPSSGYNCTDSKSSAPWDLKKQQCSLSHVQVGDYLSFFASWTHCNEQYDQKHWNTNISHYWHMPLNTKPVTLYMYLQLHCYHFLHIEPTVLHIKEKTTINCNF